jgi:hypothetical protein
MESWPLPRHLRLSASIVTDSRGRKLEQIRTAYKAIHISLLLTNGSQSYFSLIRYGLPTFSYQTTPLLIPCYTNPK